MLAKSRPLINEFIGQRSRLGVIEHAIELLRDHDRVSELPFVGEPEQFRVRHGVP